MTTEARPTAERAALEGTLGDLHLFELLELLATTHQTGTLYIAGTRAAAVTVVDGEVSFATDDPNRSLREILLGRSPFTEATWAPPLKDRTPELAAARVGLSAADVVGV